MTVQLLPVSALRAWRRQSRSVTVVDARHQAEYAAAHIPGAAHLPWEDWVSPAPASGGAQLAEPGYWGELRELSPGEWGSALGALGLAHDCPIVVYADGPRSKGREGRIAWMLIYLGATEIYLLDGGWRAWLAAGGETSAETPALAPAVFDAAPREERRARLPELRAAVLAGSSPQFVDTRDPREYAGEIHPYLPRMGHLPGAALCSFAGMFEPDGAFARPETYRDRLPAPMRGARDLVTYCEVGIRASLVALIHEIATGQVVRVFDASLMAWGLERDLPVHTGMEGN